LDGKLLFKFTKSDILIVLFAIAVFRSYVGHTISASSFIYYLALMILMTSLLKIDVQKKIFWEGFLGSIMLILFINVGLSFFGMTNNYFRPIFTGNIRLLEYFGIGLKRHGYFIFNNFSYYSMLLSILIIGISSIIEINRIVKYFTLVLSFSSLIILDDRTAVFALLIILLAKPFIKRVAPKYFLYIFISIIILPFIYYLIVINQGSINNENTAVLSSRNLIWVQFFVNYRPSFAKFLIGYGFLGQTLSNISSSYAYLFGNRGTNQAFIMSLHNSYLQYLIDVGILGLFILYRIIKQTLFKIDSLKIPEFKLLLFFLLIFGITEMSIQINNFNGFYTFMALTYYVDFKYEVV